MSQALRYNNLGASDGVPTCSSLRRLFVGFGVAHVPALAVEKPALSPDHSSPLMTQSRVSATIEFGLPALAAAVERDFPRRLATIDERISCVHRRVLFFRVNANCDIWGYVERTGPVSLYGRGDRVIGATPIYGVAQGQGANRFTARIHGETEARATLEGEARPELRHDWSLALNFGDSFHWSEPPYIRVLGRDIAIARYVEPRIRVFLAQVRGLALAAARALDLQGKAAAAWQQAFAPIELSDDPEVWLQITPQSPLSPASARIAKSSRARSNFPAMPRPSSAKRLPP